MPSRSGEVAIASRRAGALDRQERYEARTPQQQLKLLDERPGKAIKERRRLQRRIEQDAAGQN